MTTDYARLRALAEAATPGPWSAGETTDWEDVPQASVNSSNAPITWDDHGGEVFKPEDAAYIAAVNPPTLIALLDELERLRAERKLLFRDDIGRIWERLPSGLLLLTEWDNSSAHTFEEVQEDFSPLTPWEPVTGDDNA